MNSDKQISGNDEVADSTALARSVPIRKDIETAVYTKSTQGPLRVDITRPQKDKSLHRLIVLIHGGGWVSGNRADMQEIADYLAKKGFVAASIDYRLVPRSHWPAQLEDAQAAVRWLRQQASKLDIDPSEVGAAGISAGGHLSSFLGSVDAKDVKSPLSRVQCVGSISGIHDLTSPLTKEGETYGIVQGLIGEQGGVDKAQRIKASPQTFYDTHTAATLYIQGTADPLVPAKQSLDANQTLKALGVDSKVILVPDMAHGLTPRVANQAKALDELAVWMELHLK